MEMPEISNRKRQVNRCSEWLDFLFQVMEGTFIVKSCRDGLYNAINYDRMSAVEVLLFGVIGHTLLSS